VTVVSGDNALRPDRGLDAGGRDGRSDGLLNFGSFSLVLWVWKRLSSLSAYVVAVVSRPSRACTRGSFVGVRLQQALRCWLSSLSGLGVVLSVGGSVMGSSMGSVEGSVQDWSPLFGVKLLVGAVGGSVASADSLGVVSGFGDDRLVRLGWCCRRCGVGQTPDGLVRVTTGRVIHSHCIEPGMRRALRTRHHSRWCHARGLPMPFRSDACSVASMEMVPPTRPRPGSLLVAPARPCWLRGGDVGDGAV
jgi:hypothetical protein